MRRSLKTALAGVASALLLALLTFGRAAPVNAGAARFRLGQEEAGRRRSREVEEAELERGRLDEVPVEAPPGYEEAQRESVQAALEWRLQEQEREQEGEGQRRV